LGIFEKYGRTEGVDQLKLILGKLGINYSHLPYFETPKDEAGVAALCSKRDGIYREIDEGVRLASSVQYGQQNSEKIAALHSIALLIAEGNKAFIRLVSNDRIEAFHLHQGSTEQLPELREEKNISVQELCKIYFRGIALFSSDPERSRKYRVLT
jgi:hypothetical protein